MSASTDCKNQQYPLKLLGFDNIVCSNEDVLEFLELYIPPTSISYLHFDSFHKFYVVFLNDIESVCKLVGKRLAYSGCKIDILPLLDYYIVKNVYPNLTKEDVIDLFRPFGNVYDVKEHHALPNSSRFSHVLSGNREVSFMLPGCEEGVSVPGSVVCLPHTFHVIKYCPACTTEGHAMLHCPDIDDTCFSEEISTNPVHNESDFDFGNVDNEELLSEDKFHLESPTMICVSEVRSLENEEFLEETSSIQQDIIKINLHNELLSEVDAEKIICDNAGKLLEKDRIFKTKRKYPRKKVKNGNYKRCWESRKSITKRTCKTYYRSKIKSCSKNDLLKPNSKRGRKRKIPKIVLKTSLQQEKRYSSFLLTTDLDNNLSNPEILDQVPLLQQEIVAQAESEKERNTTEILDQPPLLQEITTNTESEKEKNTPDILDQPPLLQEITTNNLLKTNSKRGRKRKIPKIVLKTSLQQENRYSSYLLTTDLNNFSNPEILDQVPLLQQEIVAQAEFEKERNTLEILDQPPLLQEITTNTPLITSSCRGSNNNEVLDQTSSLQQEITANDKDIEQPKECNFNYDKVPDMESIRWKNKEIFKTKRKYVKKQFTKGDYNTRKKFLRKKIVISSKNDPLKTMSKRGRKRKIPEVLDQTPSQQQEITKKTNLKTGLKRGRKRKTLDSLDQTSLKTNLKTGLKRGRKRKTLHSLDQISKKITSSTSTKENVPEIMNNNPASQHEVSKKSADEEKICLENFLLEPSLEKVVLNAKGILPDYVLKRLLMMDLRNKKMIITYISKFTLHFDKVFSQFKMLQLQLMESDDFYTSKHSRYYNKIFTLIKTLLQNTPDNSHET